MEVENENESAVLIIIIPRGGQRIRKAIPKQWNLKKSSGCAAKCYGNDRINGMREEGLRRINRNILLLNKVLL